MYFQFGGLHIEFPTSGKVEQHWHWLTAPGKHRYIYSRSQCVHIIALTRDNNNYNNINNTMSLLLPT